MSAPASRRRAVARGIGAAVTGVVVVGATAGVAVLGADALPDLGAPAGAPTTTVRTVAVDASEQTLACPDPARLPDTAGVGDDQFDASPVPTTTQETVAVLGTATGSRLTALDGSAATDLPVGTGAAVLTGTTPDGGQALRAQPGEGPFRAVGAVASVTTAGDLRGLAAGACAAPSVEQWLVGGSTDVGGSARLVVQNPGPTAATVHLEAWGPSGQVALGSGGLFVVPAGSQVETLVEAVAPEQRRLALRVRADGGVVTSYLQHHAIAGLLPVGVDLVTAGSAPATSLVVPGIVSGGESVDDPDAPQLRLLAPGTEAGAARVSVYGPDGLVRLRGGESVDLAPGAVTDLSLGGLPAGTYAVVVDTDVPVVAAATWARTGSPAEDAVDDTAPVDRAWVPALATPVPAATTGASAAASAAAGTDDRGRAAVPPGTTASVTLVGVPDDRDPSTDPTGSATATVRAYAADGSVAGERTVDLTAGTVVTLAVDDVAPGAAVVEVESDDAVAWSLGLTADDGTATPGTLVSTIVPTAQVAEPGDVAVREVAVDGLED